MHAPTHETWARAGPKAERDIDEFPETFEETWAAVFKACADFGLCLEAVYLRPSMMNTVRSAWAPLLCQCRGRSRCRAGPVCRPPYRPHGASTTSSISHSPGAAQTRYWAASIVSTRSVRTSFTILRDSVRWKV